MTEWLKLMLEEIARKQAEHASGLAEDALRARERAAAGPEKVGAQARPERQVRATKP